MNFLFCPKVLVNGSLQSPSMLDIVDWLLKDNFDVEMCVIGHLLAIAPVVINCPARPKLTAGTRQNRQNSAERHSTDVRCYIWV